MSSFRSAFASTSMSAVKQAQRQLLSPSSIPFAAAQSMPRTCLTAASISAGSMRLPLILIMSFDRPRRI